MFVAQTPNLDHSAIEMAMSYQGGNRTCDIDQLLKKCSFLSGLYRTRRAFTWMSDSPLSYNSEFCMDIHASIGPVCLLDSGVLGRQE